MSKKKKTGFLPVIVCFFTAFVLYADSNLSTGSENIKLKLHGYTHLWAGQVLRGTGPDGAFIDVDGLWTEEAYTGLSFEALYKEHLRIVAGAEVKMYFSWPQERDFFVTKYARHDVLMGPTYGNLTFPETKIGDMDIYLGYFGYKYNADVKNLGEYMFRSGTYPAYIITYFDYPLANLLGFCFSHKMFEKSLGYDLLFVSETNFYPAMDWSLSFLAKYDFLNKSFFEIGAGFSFAHLLSVYNEKYDESHVGDLTDPKDLSLAGNWYIDENGDTAYYTFRGNKFMTRFSLNPLAFLSKDNTFFGREDFKLYMELNIIGLKSYPDSVLTRPAVYDTTGDTITEISPAGYRVQPSYNTLHERMPVTFGINIPTFNILDVLSLEFEWFKSKYYNDYYEIYIVNSLPTAPALNPDIDESKWKWSLYVKKTFFDGHFAITAQFARDHMRLQSARYANSNHREMLIERGDCWWVTKFSFMF